MDNTGKFPKTAVPFCNILNQDSKQLQSLLATCQFGIFISNPHMVPKYKTDINYVFLCLFIMYSSSLLWGLGGVFIYFYYNQSINQKLQKSVTSSCGVAVLWDFLFGWLWFFYYCFGFCVCVCGFVFVSFFFFLRQTVIIYFAMLFQLSKIPIFMYT